MKSKTNNPRERELEAQINTLTRDNNDLRKRLGKMQERTMKYVLENRELRKQLGLKPNGPYVKEIRI